MTIEDMKLKIEELEEEVEQLRYEKRELIKELKECEMRCKYDNYSVGYGDNFYEDF